jgi:DNA-binding transcriptional regulator YiaG
MASSFRVYGLGRLSAMDGRPPVREALAMSDTDTETITKCHQSNGGSGRFPVTAHEAAQVSLVRALCASGRARELRLEKGLSVREVAAAAGASQPAVTRWETGRSRPRTAYALKLADLYSELMATDLVASVDD